MLGSSQTPHNILLWRLLYELTGAAGVISGSLYVFLKLQRGMLTEIY